MLKSKARCILGDFTANEKCHQRKRYWVKQALRFPVLLMSECRGHKDALRIGAPLLGDRLRELELFTWEREGSRENLEHLPLPKGAQ